MRRILAVAFLGMSLGLGTSAALAGDNFDYTDRQPQQVQGNQMQVPDRTQQAAPAGPAPAQPWAHQVRDDFEGGR